jgi:hypothetical protein
VPQIPDVPEDEESGEDIVVTGPEGDRFKIELPDLPERPVRERPTGPRDSLFKR